MSRLGPEGAGPASKQRCTFSFSSSRYQRRSAPTRDPARARGGGRGAPPRGLTLRVVRVAHTSLLTKAVASLRRPNLLHGMLEPLDLGVAVAVRMRPSPPGEGVARGG